MIDHLDYIQKMGFTQLWPTPLVENRHAGRLLPGYAATDYYKTDPRYGTNEDYLRLSTEARGKRGIGLIQDVVPNHIGLNHWWMKDMPMPDWINYGGKFVATTHHHNGRPGTRTHRRKTRQLHQGLVQPGHAGHEPGQPVRRQLPDPEPHLVDQYAGLTGLRIDTFGYSNNDFLTEYTKRLTTEYPHINMVGEEWNKQPAVVSHWLRGKVNFDGYVSYMPSMMDFPLTLAMREALGPTRRARTSRRRLPDRLAGLHCTRTRPTWSCSRVTTTCRTCSAPVNDDVDR